MKQYKQFSCQVLKFALQVYDTDLVRMPYEYSLWDTIKYTCEPF